MRAVKGSMVATLVCGLLALPVLTSTGTPASAAGTNKTVDVLVVGAGTSGIAAAVQAKRSGAGRVLLIEETDFIGGQISAGVGTIDEGGKDRQDQRQEGIWGEFARGFLAQYKAAGWPHASTCYGARRAGDGLCVSPSIARKVYSAALSRAGVELWQRTSVSGVTRSGTKVVGATVERYGIGTVAVTSKVVIDATEYGDLLPLAGAAYRAGNGIVDPAVPSAQAAGAIQDITWPAIMRRYPRTSDGSRTVPRVLDLRGKPFPTALDDPSPAVTKSKVLGWFKSRVVRSGGYAVNTERPWNFGWHNQYRGLPDVAGSRPFLASQTERISRTGINFANDYPNKLAGDSVDDLPVRYLEDPVYRRTIECGAKLRTLQFAWYVQNSLNYPDWAVANDEGFATPWNRTEGRCANLPTSLDGLQRNMPVRPYVRESKRGIGETTVTARQIYRSAHGSRTTDRSGNQVTSIFAAPTRPTSIAVGYYRIDLHGASYNSQLEQGLESLADWPPKKPVLPYGPFSIPLEALIPRDLDGLVLAEKNISQTRSVNGASRLQPETSLVGMAAGQLAAMSVRRGVSARAIPAADVQWDLVQRGSYVSTRRFVDLPRSSTLTRYAELGATWGVLPGASQTVFGENTTLSRAAAAAWVRRAVGIPSARPTAGRFTDWSTSRSYAKDVEALAARGVPMACATRRFCPSKPITRAQLAVWLVTAHDAVKGTNYARSYVHRGPALADVAVSGTMTSRSIYLLTDATRSTVVNGRFRPSQIARRSDATVMAPQVRRWVLRGSVPISK